MRIPTLQGLIDRRMLVNFIADPAIVQKILPTPFRPKLFNNKAVVGICLIRLKEIRPKGFPSFLSLASENAAHRIAVEWDENGSTREGVYIPRRDTSSWMNTLAGGRLFPGKHHHAVFDVKEDAGNYHIAFASSDGTSIMVEANKSDQLPENSIFNDLETASSFFKNGSVGFSPNGGKHDGIELKTLDWKVSPLHVTKVRSSFFDNESVFPKGSIEFDNALLMTKLQHEWNSVEL